MVLGLTGGEWYVSHSCPFAEDFLDAPTGATTWRGGKRTTTTTTRMRPVALLLPDISSSAVGGMPSSLLTKDMLAQRLMGWSATRTAHRSVKAKV